MGAVLIMGKKQNSLIKTVKIIFIVLISVCIAASCFIIKVSAKQIKNTVNEEYKKFLENKYGFEIIIDESVKNKKNGGFYKNPVFVKDIELKILKDIDCAFSMLPDGFLKEVNEYFINKQFIPAICIVYGIFKDGEGIATGKFYWEDISIRIVGDGNNLILNLLHEFGHEIECYLWYKNFYKNVENYFTEQNKTSVYQYNEKNNL